MGHVLDAVGDVGTAIGKSPIGKYGHYVADAAALATGNPELIPVIEGANSAASNYGQTHNFGSAAKAGGLSAGGAYLGGQIGGALGSDLGTIGGAAGTQGSTFGANALAAGIGSQAANNILGTSVGAALGGYAGQNFASSFAPQAKPKLPAPEAGFSPSQATAAALPGSIAGMSNLSPLQQSTGLANQGTYGGGLGPEENSYFLNLENRRLVNSDNSTNDLSTLQPIENSYLAKLGLGGYGDTTSLLKAISQWKAA